MEITVIRKLLEAYFVAVCCFTFLARQRNTKDHAKARSIVEVTLAIAAPLKRSIVPPKQRSLAHTLFTAFLLLSVFVRNTWHEQAGPHDLQLLLGKFDYDDSGVLCSLESQDRRPLMSHSHSSRTSTQTNFFFLENTDLLYFIYFIIYHLHAFFFY